MSTQTSQTALMVVAERMGAELLPADDRYTHKMEIRSETTSKKYVVARLRHDEVGEKETLLAGTWKCSCPGWIMKKPGKPRGCKHLTEMLPMLERMTRDPNLFSPRRSR